MEVYTKGIELLDHWRLYWARANVKIKMAQESSRDANWEEQEIYYKQAEQDMRQAIKGQDANARIWISYAKCAMALGDRAGTERGLQKAKEYGQGYIYSTKLSDYIVPIT